VNNKRMTKKYRPIPVLIGLLLATPAAMASNTDTPFDFSLDFERHDIDLKGGTKLELNTVGFRYSEFISSPLRLDLLMGWSGVKHRENATALGEEPVGYYAGLGLDAATNPRYRLQAGMNLSYRYFAHKTELDSTTDLELEWSQTEGKLWAGGRITDRLLAYGCYYKIKLDGEQNLKGTSPETLNLETKRDTGPCGGLRYAMPNSGYIGIELNNGMQRGGHIYFGKVFDH